MLPSSLTTITTTNIETTTILPSNHNGEMDLSILINNMKPVLHPDEYVFCCIPNLDMIDINNIIQMFREIEGITIIVTKAYADDLSLPYTFISSWITLNIHSSLDAIGFTAAFTKVLTQSHISCNVIAGYYHDHIFINSKDTLIAMQVLENFGNK